MPDPTADDRAAAVRALRVHLDAGRLTPGAYEDREVAATTAAGWDELELLFADLPSPRVSWSGDYGTPVGPPRDATAVEPPAGRPRRNAPTPVPAPASTPAAAVPEPGWSIALRRVSQAAPLIALLLFFVTKSWLWFLLVPVVLILAGSRDDRSRRGPG